MAHDIHDRGGMERACAELIRQCHHRVRFVVVAVHLAPELVPLVQRWVRIDAPQRPFPLKFAAFYLRAGRALSGLDADIVHTVGAIVPNRVDVAAIHFCHAGFRASGAASASQAGPLVRRLNTAATSWLALGAERWSYRPGRLRSFTAVSNGVGAELAQHYPAIPVTVVPNGVDLVRFGPEPDEAEGMRVEAGAGAGDLVALFVGGDWGRKGLRLAIEATALARRQGVPAVLWVLGKGDTEAFAHLAEALGVGGEVHFFGFRSDTERFYRAADVLVMPSSYEAFPLTALEAAASGVPVVASHLHGVDDLVGDNQAGLVVEAVPEAFASALAKLAGDANLLSEMGEEGRRRVAGYTWERSAATTLDLWERLADQPSRRGSRQEVTARSPARGYGGEVETRQGVEMGSAELYLDLLKACLTREIMRERYRRLSTTGWKGRAWSLPAQLLAELGVEVVRREPSDPQLRAEGHDWPPDAETMIGRLRLDSLQHCINQVVTDGVPGDFIETGVWRGGSVIFMRGALKAYGDSGRTVWVADSFKGLPHPDVASYPHDAGDELWTHPALAISLEEVKSNFARYGLLDDRVRFLVGWFKDTLPSAPIERLALLRLDGDLYESTMDALAALYPKLSPGGYVIVDDYGAMPPCKAAVQDYRAANGITEEVVTIDWTGVYWRRER